MQIDNNTEMIASLNSTRPSGYVSMITNLTQEIHQEEYLLTVINSMNVAGSTTANHRRPVARSPTLDNEPGDSRGPTGIGSPTAGQ
jgi:hypothetical protein